MKKKTLWQGSVYETNVDFSLKFLLVKLKITINLLLIFLRENDQIFYYDLNLYIDVSDFFMISKLDFTYEIINSSNKDFIKYNFCRSIPKDLIKKIKNIYDGSSSLFGILNIFKDFLILINFLLR